MLRRLGFRHARHLLFSSLLGFGSLAILTGGLQTCTAPITLPLEALLAAPEQVEIAGRTYILETYLWRDFMPASPPDGKPLIASIHIVPQDSGVFPPSLDANRLWVIKGKEVWETSFSNEEIFQDAHQLGKVARNGPKWGPGIAVDVVVRLKDTQHGVFLLRAAKQLIHRTD